MSDLTPFIQKLRDALPTSAVVGRFVKLKKHGYEYQGLCPFHSEKTPSFTVNDRKGFFHCFGCGAHGDIVGFLMQHQSIPFLEAVQQLADQAGLMVPKITAKNASYEEESQKLFDACEAACKLFEATLAETIFAREYLTKRGVLDKTTKKYRLGFATQKAVDQLIKNGFKADLLAKAGLTVSASNTALRFRDRLIVPIFNRQGKVIAFGGRAMLDGQQPKYYNSPETPLFHKSTTLYGANFIGKVGKDAPLYVVEGYFDAISCIEGGLNAVAPLGTALTPDHMQALWRLSFEPILCFDGDLAGQKAALRACYNALPILKAGYSFQILQLPEKADPDSFLREKGLEAFKNLPIKNLVEVLITNYQKDLAGKAPEQKAKIKKEFLEAIDSIEDKDVKSFYKQTFYETASAKPSPSKKDPSKNIIQASPKKNDVAQKILLATLINHPTLIATVAEELMSVTFTLPGATNLIQLMLEQCTTGEWESFEKHEDVQRFLQSLDLDAMITVAPFIKKESPFGEAEIGFKDVWHRYVVKNDLRRTLNEYEKKLKESFDPKIWEALKQIQRDLLTQENT